MNERAQQTLFWGVLRYLLGMAQMLFAIGSLVLLLTVGLELRTYVFVACATALTIASRLLYKGRRDPTHKRNDKRLRR